MRQLTWYREVIVKKDRAVRALNQKSSSSAEFLGIEIGGTKLQIVIGESGRIRLRKRFEVDVDAGGKGIRAQISSTLPELIAQNQIRKRRRSNGRNHPFDRMRVKEKSVTKSFAKALKFCLDAQIVRPIGVLQP